MAETYELLIRESHMDTFGHMNNAMYLQIMEEARWDMITQRGFGLKQIMAIKQGPVILEVNLKFMKEIHLREKVQITTDLVDYSGKIGHLMQKIIKANGHVAAEALFTFGLFDLKDRKLIDPTPEWRKAVGLD
jgi:YbgC/YbaW family acyl-CoA thioester hydrolase